LFPLWEKAFFILIQSNRKNPFAKHLKKERKIRTETVTRGVTTEDIEQLCDGLSKAYALKDCNIKILQSHMA
jgi:hypothetical protein